MGRPQKAANVRNPHIEDLQKDKKKKKKKKKKKRKKEKKIKNPKNEKLKKKQKKKKDTYWKKDTEVDEYIAAHDKIRERSYL